MEDPVLMTYEPCQSMLLVVMRKTIPLVRASLMYECEGVLTQQPHKEASEHMFTAEWTIILLLTMQQEQILTHTVHSSGQ